MKNVDYKKLKRYDIGKRQNMFSGYQQGDQIDSSEFSSTPSSSFGGYADGINSTIIPSVITKGLGYTSTWIPMFTEGWNTAKEVANMSTNVASNASNTASTAGSSAGTAASVGLNSLGKLTGLAGAAMGGINIANDINAFDDMVITSSDMLNSTGRSTQSKYGELYTTYTGLDTAGIESTVDAANRRDKTNLVVDSTSTGLTVGSTIGGFFGPWGSIIGGALGSIGGLLAGWFGGESASERRKREVKEAEDSLSLATTNYNQQAEAEAASRGLRKQFMYNRKPYDAGKLGLSSYIDNLISGGPKNKRIKYVHTTKGVEPGYELGLGGKGETMFNPNTGEASLIKEGKKRVDNISVGVPLDHYNGGKMSLAGNEWADTVILGNTVNPETGNLISEDAKSYTKTLEKLNRETPMTKIGKRTKELNEKNALAALNHLSDVQAMNHYIEGLKYNCGKPRFDSGLSNYLSTIIPHLTQLGVLFGNKKSYEPTYTDTYVEDGADADINRLASIQLDPTQPVQNLRKQRKQSRYATTHQGGLSGGQIAAISSMSNLATANAINNVLSDYKYKNAQLYSDALKTSIAAKQSRAARKQQANAKFVDDRAKAYAAKFNNNQAWVKSIYDQLGAIGKDISSVAQYNDALKYKNSLLNLYQQNLTREQQDLLNNYKSASPYSQIGSGTFIIPGNYNLSGYSAIPTTLFGIQRRLNQIR